MIDLLPEALSILILGSLEIFGLQNLVILQGLSLLELIIFIVIRVVSMLLLLILLRFVRFLEVSILCLWLSFLFLL